MSLVNGLPAHVLIVHFVVVLVPLSAHAVVVGAIGRAPPGAWDLCRHCWPW